MILGEVGMKDDVVVKHLNTPSNWPEQFCVHTLPLQLAILMNSLFL